MVERLNGLDTGMLAGETPEWHMHAGALVLLEPIDGHDARRRRRHPRGAERPARAPRPVPVPPPRSAPGPRPLGLGRFRRPRPRRAGAARRCPRTGRDARGRGPRRRPVLLPAEPGRSALGDLGAGGPPERSRRPPDQGAPRADGRHPRRAPARGALRPRARTRRSRGPTASRSRPTVHPSRLRMLVDSGVFLAGTPLRALHLGAELVSAGEQARTRAGVARTGAPRRCRSERRAPR